jgi:hypothetical protein
MLMDLPRTDYSDKKVEKQVSSASELFGIMNTK